MQQENQRSLAMTTCNIENIFETTILSIKINYFKKYSICQV